MLQELGGDGDRNREWQRWQAPGTAVECQPCESDAEEQPVRQRQRTGVGEAPCKFGERQPDGGCGAGVRRGDLGPPAAEVGTANSVGANSVATNLADTLPSPAQTELAPAKAKPSPATVASNDGLQLRPSSDMSMPTEAKANALGNRAWLTVSVTDKAWVQVKDKSGAVLFEKMLTANSSDKIEAQPPLFVWLGNAKATSLDYMGKSVDVASKTFNNTARLTLE